MRVAKRAGEARGRGALKGGTPGGGKVEGSPLRWWGGKIALRARGAKRCGGRS